MRPKNESNHELSDCEKLIMKAVWDAGEDIAMQDLIVRMRESYGKDYARTTLVTFLGKMADKGYVSTYRIGKHAFVHAEKTEDAYMKERLKNETDFWFGGSPAKLMSALVDSQEIPEEEWEKMRRMLDVLGD